MSEVPGGGISWRTRAALVGLGLLLALALAELLLRLVMPAPSTQYTGLTRAFAEALLVDDAVLHHRPRPSGSARIGGVDYRFDTDALRGDGRRTSALAVGDSVTMGWGVAEADAWPARLRPPAMNGGVLGYGVGEVVGRAEMLASTLGGVETLLVGYYPNDPEPAEANTQGAGPPSSWALVRLIERLGRETASERYTQLHAPESASLARVAEGFDRLAGLKKGVSRRLVVVLLPALEAFDDAAVYQLAAVHGRVMGMATRAGLEVIDLAPVAAGLPGGPRRYWVAADDPHPNAEAHAAYAAHINAYLAQPP